MYKEAISKTPTVANSIRQVGFWMHKLQAEKEEMEEGIYIF